MELVQHHRIYIWFLIVNLHFSLTQSSCVYGRSGFVAALATVPENATTTTFIDICTPRFMVARCEEGPAVEGFDISFKSISLRCKLPNRTRSVCTLDAGRCQQLFYGQGVRFSASNFNFVEASYYFGGGGSFSLSNSSLSLTRCNFVRNGGRFGGGAMYLSHSRLTMYGGSIRNCGSYGAGGIALYNSSFVGTNVLFSENSVSYSDGAISAQLSRLKLRSVRFVNNKSGTTGGALGIYSSDLDIADSAFINNTAYSGGVGTFSNSTVKFTRVRFIGNTAIEDNYVYEFYSDKAHSLLVEDSDLFLRSTEFSSPMSNFPNVTLHSSLLVTRSKVDIQSSRFVDGISKADIKCTNSSIVSVSNTTFVSLKERFSYNFMIGNSAIGDDGSSVVCGAEVRFCNGEKIKDYGTILSTNCQREGIDNCTV